MWTRRSLLRTIPALGALTRLRGEGPIEIPGRLNDFHQILAPARINGSPPLWLELDTGGGGALCFIDSSRAAAIGVRPTGMGRSAGATENQMAADGRAIVT